MTVRPLGDSAVVIAVSETISTDTAARVREIAIEISRKPPRGVVDVVPAFGQIAVFFEPTQAAAFQELAGALTALVERAETAVVSAPTRIVEIPVCYGGEYGPDLDQVAAHAGKLPREVISLHSGAEYVVQAIGFSPGFPYLGGLPAELAAPRRATPRPSVPAGSVGIGGAQTGIYPLETPGGWNLIGRTPRRLFDASRAEPALLGAGDHVRFRAIPPDEYERVVRSEAELSAGAAPPDEEPEPDEGQGSASSASAHDFASGFEVVRAGMYTTVQDSGRRGHRSRGVPLSGAADYFALRVANLLVGNDEHDAGLEFTLVGPELRFLRDTVIAICGGEFDDLPEWRPVAVRAGTKLRIGAARRGCRGYLAIAGGIAVEPVLGSRSTYVRAGMGGHEGRMLKDGDVLPVPQVERAFRDHWRIDERILPRYSAMATVRVLPGPQVSEFDSDWTDRPFTISTQSDRMGMRLMGVALQRSTASDLLSLPVSPGTIQVPPDGLPIVLLADAQTIGGYPQVAYVITVDLPVMAQLRPGDEVRFVVVTLENARELMAAQERALGLLREGVAQKLA
jgi:KipI family sensor histidine kinase inhibitor